MVPRSFHFFRLFEFNLQILHYRSDRDSTHDPALFPSLSSQFPVRASESTRSGHRGRVELSPNVYFAGPAFPRSPVPYSKMRAYKHTSIPSSHRFHHIHSFIHFEEGYLNFLLAL
jgi:hypothetical protein